MQIGHDHRNDRSRSPEYAIYNLIETAKANGLSPYDYLQFVFATLPTLNADELHTLLPWQWKETLPV